MRITFYNAIKNMEIKNYLRYHLKFQLAPVIMGGKPSATLALTTAQLNQCWESEGREMLAELGLEAIVLRQTGCKKIILFYKHCLIEEILMQLPIKHFLNKIGYTYQTAEEALEELANRYQKINCPHELGVFLGFPLDDIVDFESNHKTCLLCGYWKVYNNLEQAQEIFNQYDQAKFMMIKHLMKDLKQAS